MLNATLISASAQRFEQLDANNIKAGFGLGGNLFSNLPDTIMDYSDTCYAYFEAPKGSGIKAVYTASLWMSATHDSSLYASFQTFRTSRNLRYFDGPVWTNINEEYHDYFHRVFKITRQDISEHLQHFPLVSSTVTPWQVLYWPAKGNPYVLSDFGLNINRSMAPFFDADADGIYNPLNGDLPKLCGEEAVFFMLNDANRPYRATDTAQALGIEVRGYAEVFTDPHSTMMKGALNNTVFVRYEIENFSLNNYTDFRIGLFEDPDLGNLGNDGVSADTALNVMYCYNRSHPDVNAQGDLGYGSLYSTHGVALLNTNLDEFIFNRAWVNYTEEIPVTATGINAALHGIVVGDSSPFPLTPIDKKIMGASALGNFGVREIKSFDLAFVTCYDSTSSLTGIVDTLKRDVEVIRLKYEMGLFDCSAEGLGLLQEQAVESIILYPNPTTDLLYIQSSVPFNNITVLDVQGAVLLNTLTEKRNMDVSKLAVGIYWLKLQTNSGQVVTKRFVKQ